MLISIVYDSGWGHTVKKAQSVAEGVRRVAGAEARLIAVSERRIPWDALEASDAIVLGSPTCNGSSSARFKQFCEMALFAAQHGILWVGVGLDLKPDGGDSLGSVHDLDHLGSWLGEVAQSNSDQRPDDTPIQSYLNTASYLGQRVAETVRRLKPA